MSDEDLAAKTQKSLNIKPSGGGGGPAFTFKSSFNLGATEFVPSWGSPVSSAAVSSAAVSSAAVSSAAATTAPAKAVSLSLNKQQTTKPEAKVIKEVKEVKDLPKEPVKEDVLDDQDEEEVDPFAEGAKEHLNIIFMGHVDAGKSTMGGHILLLTGMVDKRTMDKYEREAKELGRESWYLSWALDLNQEERNKGKTTEYGRGYFETERRRFTVLDAPGHKTFVPSMIGGAAQADVGILVISARKGEFETGFEKGGQTREHALLAKTAGVKRLVLAINKMDDPTVEFAKERYDECVSKMMPFIRGVGFQKSEIDVLPVSGFTGANLKDRVDSSVCDWYDGPSLLELLDGLKVDRKYSGPFLMPVADKMKDMGTVVQGKIESGHVKKGQTVLVMPNKRSAEVTAVFQEDNEVATAYTGDNVRLRLKGVEEEDVMRGFVLCQRSKPVHCVTAFEAQLAIVEYKSIICAGYSAVMHAHTAEEEVTLSALLHMIDKKTGRKSRHPPKFIKKGDSCIVRLEMQQNVCLETYNDYPQLGRFTLRDEGSTVAVGKILKLITE